MALTRKAAREKICIAVASQLDDINAAELIKLREDDKDVDYENDLGMDDEGKLTLVRPLNVVFKRDDISWGVAEVGGLSSIKETEDRALEKSKP
jgi:hypothetical protein